MSTADFSTTTEGVTVDVAAGTATGPEIGTVSLDGATDVVGGSGADAITGDLNANLLQGGLGNDVLRGGGGGDTIEGGDNDDQLYGDGGADTLKGEAGNDYLNGGLGTDRLEGGADHDQLVDNDSGDDVLIGGTGNDSLSVYRNQGGSSVSLEGNEGYDSLSVSGSFASVSLSGGDQDDHLHANGQWAGGIGSGTLDGGSGNDVLEANNTASNLQLLGGTGDDKIYNRYNSDHNTLDGGDDNDYIISYSANYATIKGGAGQDEIWTQYTYASSIDAGSEADTLSLNSSSFSSVDAGTGDDKITLNGSSAGTINAGMGADTIALNGSSAGTVDLGLDADQDTLTITAVVPEILVQNFTAGAGGDILQLSPLLNQFVPHWDGDANPWGPAGFLKLVQQGADTLVQVDPDGAGGSGAFQTLVRLEGVTLADLTNANINAGGYPLDGSEATEGETYTGDDGNNEHTGTAGPDLLQGGLGNDVLRGGGGGDTIEGGDNDDQLYGDGGADTLKGEAGNDYLNGGLGTDRLEGGADHDQLVDNDSGDDVLIGGTGNDSLSVYRNQGGSSVSLEGNEGYDSLSVSGSFASVSLSGGDQDDHLHANGQWAGGIGSGTLDGGSGNDVLEANNTASNLQLLGGTGDDKIYNRYNSDHNTLDGGDDNDYIISYSANYATIKGGAGQDEIWTQYTYASSIDAGSEADTLSLNSSSFSSVDAGTGDDKITLNGSSAGTINAGMGADTIALNGSSAGTVDLGLDADQDTLTITAVVPEILVQNFTAGAGGDILQLSPLLNQFVPHWDGDANPWGPAGFLKLVQQGADTLVQVDPDGAGGSGAFQTLVRLEGVTLADLTNANINAGGYPLDGSEATEGETYTGDDGNNEHTGTAGPDLLQGGLGNDVLRGGGGGDTIEGGDNDDQLYGDGGADTLKGEAGNDYLNGGLGTDRLEGGADHDQLVDNDSGDDVLIGGTGNDSLSVYRNQGGSSVSLEGNEGYDSLSVSGSFASVSLSGGDQDDHLHANGQWAGGIGSGTLDGGSGNDVLEANNTASNLQLLGGTGDDKIYNRYNSDHNTLDGGDDNDYIISYSANYATIKGGAGQDEIWTQYTYASSIDAGSEADTLSLNSSSFSSVDAGTGDDKITLNGSSAGTINAGMGADTIALNGSSAGTVDLGLDADQDTLTITAVVPEILVQNFTAGAGGDILQLSPLLNQFVPHWDGDANPWGPAGFLKLVQQGADTLVQVDPDGAGGSGAFQTLVRLEGVTLADLTNANINAGGYPLEISEQVLITSTSGVKGTNSLEITGTAKPGSMVDLYEGDTLLGQTVVEEDGTWRIPVDGLSDGPHTFVAKALNENGTPTGTSPALDLVVDTVPPDAPIIEVQDGLTNNAMPTLVGLGEAGATIKIFLDDNPVAIGETIVGPDSTWTLTLQPALPEGEHILKAVAVDEAGHESLVTDLSLIVDTLPPGMLAFDIEPGSLLTSNALTLSGRGGEPGATVEISDGGVRLGATTVSEDGTWSMDVADLAEGEHTFTAVAVDEAGNPSESALLPIGIDTVAPEQPVVLSQEGFTTDNTPFIHGLGEVGTTITVQDGLDVLGTTTVLDDGTWSFDFASTFADRTYNFSLTATDKAGHVSDETAYQFTVDTLAPNAPAVVTPGQNGVVLPGALTLTGEAEPGSTVRVYEGGVVIGETFAEADGTWSLLTEPLSEGVHALSVKSQDEAGNISPAKDLSVFARTGPLVTLTSAALTSDAGASSTDNISNQGGMTLTGTADPGATITLYGGVDGTTKLSGSTIVGASGTWSLTTTLPEGTHNLSVQATYKSGFVGKTEPTADTYIIDKTPPTTLATPTLTTDTPMVSGQTTDTTPTIKGTGAEANTKVLVYDNGALLGTTKSDAAGAWSLTPTSGLADGKHSFTAKQEDLAGNLSAFSTASSVTIDTTAPAVPSVTRISDDLGASGSDGITSDNSLWVYGTAEASSTVKVYNGTTLIGTVKAGSTGAWSLDYTKTLLKDGSYDLTAVASDALGNTSAASSVFKVTVDRTAPTATITSALTDSGATASVSNGGATKDASLTLVGKAEAGAAVEVKLGSLVVGTTTANASGDWSLDYTAASDGKLTFTATTKDLAGNTSTAASFAVTVDTKAPTSEVTAAVTSKSTLISGTADAGSAVQILENGSVIGTTTAGNNGTWKVTLSPALSDTVHTLTSRATDQVGNVGQQAGVTLVGSSLGDTLTGNATNDVLLGYGGADKLNGGAGNDRYTGGTGADTFMFLGQFGTDTVTDYVDNSDKLDLDAGLSFANLTFTTVDADGDKMADDVLIKTSTGQSINVLNMAAASLTASDFQF